LLFTSGVAGAWYDPSDVLLNWRTNLLTYSQEFDNAAWTPDTLLAFGSGSVANATTAPDGTTTADKIVLSAVSGQQRIYSSANPATVGTYTYSVYAKPAGYNFVGITIFDGVSYKGGVVFNVSTGEILSSPTPVGTATIVAAGNGWYRVSVSCTTAGSMVNSFTGIRAFSSAPAAINGASTGNGTDGVYIWGAQLELGSTATTYQAITTPEQTYLLYDPQPVLYQDSAGTTPVTAVEQAVRLMLDKSQGLVLGSELVTNGDFTVGTGWSTGGVWVISGGAASITSSTTSLSQSTLAAVVGTWYQVTFTISAFTSGGVRVEFGGVNGVSRTAAGTYTQYILATSTSFLVISPVATSTLSIDNVSIKSLAGNHALAPNDPSRPILRARYNLLTYSEQFDNAAWTKVRGTITQTSETSPIETATADVLTQTTGQTTSALAYINGTILSAPASTAYTFSVYAKKGGKNFLTIGTDATGAAGSNLYSYFNISNGTLGTAASGHTITITDSGNGWYRCTLTATTRASVQNVTYYIGHADTDNSLTVTDSGSTSIWGADLRTGSSAGTYQRIAAATDYDTAGFLPYLALDGSDDYVASAAINFSTTDKMTLCSGITKNSNSLRGVFAHLGSGTAATFRAEAPDAALNTFTFYTTGTGVLQGSGTVVAAPATRVFTGIGDIAADINLLRLNGVQVASNTTDQGTGNYSNAVLNVGRRGDGSLFFTGNIYQFIVCGKTLSASELASTEAYVATKTGVTL
jgi:hypothetical protein